jgi:hypothetical protein
MCNSTLFPRRIARGLAVLFTFGAASGCADPSGPAPSVSPNAIIIIGGHPMVFNAQLRFIGNPDVKPLRAVEGHLQLKIHDSGETGLVINWKAHILNPECESSTSFGGGIYSIQDSEDFPSPEDLALIDLRSPERVLGCGDNLLEGAIGISAELAARLIFDPEDFVAVFFLDDGGIIAGTLQLGGPDM